MNETNKTAEEVEERRRRWCFDTVIFVDVETTGLWPVGRFLPDQPPRLLELSLVAAQVGAGGQLKETANFTRLNADLTRGCYDWHAHPKAQEIHEESGLLEELFGAGDPAQDCHRIPIAPLDVIAEQAAAFVSRHSGVWAGWSPGSLDVPVIRWWLPQLYAAFRSHRVLDISTVRALMLNCMGFDPDALLQKTVHRAYQDNLSALEALSSYLQVFERAGSQLEREAVMEHVFGIVE
jgi:oligoribonuclease (3'-5' exoribonuclease)